MNKASLLASAAVTSIIALGSFAVPAHAQTGGPFADVPADHWAYKSVDQLQKAGIVIGYLDGTYGGKRAMTRYEFAVAIARLLDKMQTGVKIPDNLVTTDMLNQALVPYAKKSDLEAYALKSDLAGFAKETEVDELRKLVREFQTELTALGVDIDATNRRLAALENRVNAIENEMKRVQISGGVNVMARGNNRFSGAASVVDEDGFVVTGGGGSRGGILADTRVLHDVDLDIKARLSKTATAEAVLNFGNYLSYLNSIGSYSGARSNNSFGQVSQNETQTVYKAIVETPIRLWGIGNADLVVGRMPLQLTPYTLKLIDVDSYFSNSKTDQGDIPVDGGKARFSLGPVTATAFAGKTDPVKYLSDIYGAFPDQAGGYGIYAGASHGPLQSTTGFGPGTRPIGSLINPVADGALSIEQLAGVRATFGNAKWGTIGANYIVASGPGSGSFFTPVPGGTTDFYFDRVFIYGADINTHLSSIGIVGSYTKTDTAGETLGNVVGGVQLVNTKTSNKVTNDNAAWDAAANWDPGKFSLVGGYKEIDPFFAAPGSWDKIGAWTNPVGIKGPYVKGKYAFSSTLALKVEGRFYQGDGKDLAAGGLTTDDKIQNLKAGFSYGLNQASGIDAGIERTEYQAGGGSLGGNKPIEYFYNIGYGYSFTPLTSLKLGYQIVDYRDSNSGFDGIGDTKGGIGTAQFSVKF